VQEPGKTYIIFKAGTTPGEVTVTGNFGSLTPGTIKLYIGVPDPTGSDPFGNVKAYPNPFVPTTGNPMRFTDLSTRAEVKVYTLSGKLVRSLSESGGEATWNGKNTDEQSIAPGIYLYVIRDSQKNKKTGKIAISK
jgi:hypothetical protein